MADSSSEPLNGAPEASSRRSGPPLAADGVVPAANSSNELILNAMEARDALFDHFSIARGESLPGPVDREEALGYALQFGRGLDRAKADRFVGMYVNELTLNYGDRGRMAVTRLLDEAWEKRLIPKPVVVEYSS